MSKGGMPPGTSRSIGVLVWNIWPDHFACVTRSSYGSAAHIRSQVLGDCSSSRRAVTTTPSSSISIRRAIWSPRVLPDLEGIGGGAAQLDPDVLDLGVLPDDLSIPFSRP